MEERAIFSPENREIGVLNSGGRVVQEKEKHFRKGKLKKVSMALVSSQAGRGRATKESRDRSILRDGFRKDMVASQITLRKEKTQERSISGLPRTGKNK